MTAEYYLRWLVVHSILFAVNSICLGMMIREESAVGAAMSGFVLGISVVFVGYNLVCLIMRTEQTS